MGQPGVKKKVLHHKHTNLVSNLNMRISNLIIVLKVHLINKSETMKCFIHNTLFSFFTKMKKRLFSREYVLVYFN